MSNELFSTKVTCPICEEDFNTIKVKSAALRLEKIDTDFCMHYSGINPIFYEPWICDQCGYVAYGNNFTSVSRIEKIYLEKICLEKFKNDSKNPFELTDYHKKAYDLLYTVGSNGRRNNTHAIELYKLLMSNLEAINSLNSIQARTFLKIAWIYRTMKDSSEIEYLKNAIEKFILAHKNEDLSKGKFNATSCAYLIGELYRRVNKPKEAMEWLRIVVSSPRDDENLKIIEKAREQIEVIKSSNDKKATEKLAEVSKNQK